MAADLLVHHENLHHGVRKEVAELRLVTDPVTS
jgi:hypothetical protein